MIEGNPPEINVDELMQKIREKVARHHIYAISQNSASNITTHISAIALDHIEALVNQAESRSHIRTQWPVKYKVLRIFASNKIQKLALKVLEIIFRDQREVNFNLLQALRESLLFNRQLVEQIATLQAQVNTTANHLNAIDERVDAMDNHLKAIDERVGATDNYLKAIDERVGATDNHLKAIDERVGAMDNHLKAIDERVGAMDNHLKAIDERVGATDNHLKAIDERVGAMDNHLKAIDERVGATDNYLKAIDERVGATDNHLKAIDERVGATDNHLKAIGERVGATDNHLNAIGERVGAMDERHIRDDSYLKNDLSQQKRLITLFLEQARQRLPKPFNQEQLQTIVNEEQHLLDAFYVAFEDRFRGSREEIIDRLKVYLPLIEEAKVGTQDSPILDVGCGRGEWLELLGESGYTARGLDINRVMVDQCRARGFKVLEEDVISYLQFIPDASVGAVTGFHIIEHLPFKVLIKLLDETVRVLKPGGLAIFETPNPENIVVGACNFYSDPTHLNPLFPPTIQFLAEQRGFVDVHLLRLSQDRIEDLLQFIEVDNPIAPKINPIIDIVKSRFYAAPDVAVIGRKVS